MFSALTTTISYGIKCSSPAFVSLSHAILSDYGEFYRLIMLLHNWKSVFVVIDGTSVIIYTNVCFFMANGISAFGGCRTPSDDVGK
ncbi:hypothetical protein BV898_17916 [Hypsibius exemplaris]|uniref:Uncharacterized protein n=1 Tax=Hypsibius exemplaris TaxID=2072580 RepID=A0A9X6NHU0_HYPEX|nr:hypothetical protein BV898_17916 [Hypsibius exemplaris]